MKEETVRYIRCRTCGKHIEENQSLNKVYCSEECAGTYTRCPNCGNFFAKTGKEDHNGFCSLECEAIYDEDGIIITNENRTEDKESTDLSQNENNIPKEE